MNNYSAIGRIGRDAEVRKTDAGDSVLNTSLAVDSGFGAKKQTLWFDLSLWGKRAESLVQYLKKGAQVGVSGELGTREHNDKTYLTLRVQEVSLLGGKAATP
jgi:single-strand DNA-binding protein